MHPAQPDTDTGRVDWNATADDVYINTRIFNLLYSSELLSLADSSLKPGRPGKVFANGDYAGDNGTFWPIGGEVHAVSLPNMHGAVVVPDVVYSGSEAQPETVAVSTTVLFVYLPASVAPKPKFCWPFAPGSRWTKATAKIKALEATPDGVVPKKGLAVQGTDICMPLSPARPVRLELQG